MLLIKNGTVYDGIHREPQHVDLLIEGEKISRIGDNLVVPEAEEIDASGLNVFPGFVEAHAHIGLDGYGIGYERQDYNEMGDIISSQLRAIDGINPLDPTFEMARQAGITSVCTGPGSANVLGGTFAAIKTVGSRVEEMLIREPVAMKCAFGENPKRCYREKGNSSRMSTAAHLREALMMAKDYLARKEAAGKDVSKRPAFNMKWEALIPVLKREIPLKAHAHTADDLFTAIRIAKEFDIKLTLEHCTEGHLVAEALVAEGYPMAVGPSFGHASKFELKDKSWTTPGILAKVGGQVSIITDSPVIPQQYLPLMAGMAIQAGMDPFAALQAITINPAKHIGIADRVGSLEVGKDADILLVEGLPFAIGHTMRYVFINGVNVL